MIIYRFEDAIAQGNLVDHTVEVQLGLPYRSSRYLAFENGRIAVATVSPPPGSLLTGF